MAEVDGKEVENTSRIHNICISKGDQWPIQCLDLCSKIKMLVVAEVHRCIEES